MKTSLIVAVSAVALLWFADEYPALRFRGDGRISGGPILGYQIEFKKIPFYQAGEYVFHFRGVPHEELTLELHAEGKGSDNEAELRVKTIIEAVIVDQKDRIICQASGPPLEHGQNPMAGFLCSVVMRPLTGIGTAPGYNSTHSTPTRLLCAFRASIQKHLK